jgi:ATP-binding cassette, subfamily B, bacterial
MDIRKTSIIKLVYFVYKKYFNENMATKFKVYFWLYGIFNFLVGIYPLVLSFLVARVIDISIESVSNNMPIDSVFPILIIFGAVVMLWSLINNAFVFVDTMTSLWFPYQDDEVYLKKYSEIEPQAYEDPEFINQKNTLSWNSWNISYCLYTVLEIMALLFITIISAVAISRVNIFFALIAVLSVIPSSLVTVKYGKKVWNIWNDKGGEKVKYSVYRRPLWEVIFENFQEIYVFNYAKYLIEKAKDINEKFTKRVEKNNTLREIWLTVSSLWKNSLYIFIVFFSINMLFEGNLSVGMLAFVITAYNAFNNDVYDFINKISYILYNRKLLEKFYDIQTRENKIKSGPTLLTNGDRAVRIEFKNVWFKYPNTEKWVIKNLNLSIKADEDIAIVGKNGAGKSTLLKLVMRIYDPQKGKILINGIDVKNLDLKSYYKVIGVLAQNYNRLGITVKDNIIVGDIDRKEDGDYIKAAKLADVHDTVQELPLGYDTYLTREVEGGIQLSAGQWQKVAIARAFFRKPKLLILDEPTSSVDAISEEKIFDNIMSNADNRTTLIVSHRFSTVKKAKKIMVVDEGKIIEQGNHSELMKENGLYASMYLKQNE